MKVKTYNTKARRYILEFLEQNSEVTVSAADILKYLETKGENINQATVYRYLGKLTDEKKVIKFSEGVSGKAVYQFVKQSDCDGHLHIKCVKCGKLIHLNCGFMDELKTHIEEKHEFSLKCTGSILYGICNECNKEC